MSSSPFTMSEKSDFNSTPQSSTMTTTTAKEIDWSTSFHGISSQPFTQRQADILMRPLEPQEIEIKPGKRPLTVRSHHRALTLPLTFLAPCRRTTVLA
jgi:hypothetical protein